MERKRKNATSAIWDGLHTSRPIALIAKYSFYEGQLQRRQPPPV